MFWRRSSRVREIGPNQYSVGSMLWWTSFAASLMAAVQNTSVSILCLSLLLGVSVFCYSTAPRHRLAIRVGMLLAFSFIAFALALVGSDGGYAFILVSGWTLMIVASWKSLVETRPENIASLRSLLAVTWALWILDPAPFIVGSPYAVVIQVIAAVTGLAMTVQCIEWIDDAAFPTACIWTIYLSAIIENADRYRMGLGWWWRLVMEASVRSIMFVDPAC